MLLRLANGRELRGDWIKSATLRSDCAPVPLTLEADLRAGDDQVDAQLAEGKTITVAGADTLRILKSTRVAERLVQGDRQMAGTRIVAALDACAAAAMVRRTPIIKENARLAEIYRAAGATLRGIDADFAVDRFCCPAGSVPTYAIAAALQEEGGVVRWRAGRLQFIRLADLFKGKPVMNLPNNASDDVRSGFLERHTVPWFYSLNEAGEPVYGNRGKERVARYAPFTNEQRLRNMTRCLVRRKVVRIALNVAVCAGDLIELHDGLKLAVITAAHAFASGTDAGGTREAYTRLWLGSLEE